MITAIDSSVLWAIVNAEPGHESWLQVLFQAATEGPLIISPVAFAELAPSSRDAVELTAYLDRLAIAYSPISPAAAHLAGLTFKRYRQAGGPREHLVPDFLIAAHNVFLFELRVVILIHYQYSLKNIKKILCH